MGLPARAYRESWCALREVDVIPADPDFIDATLARYAVQVGQLGRTFEMLRGEDKWLKKQPAGQFDLDSVITAFTDYARAANGPALFQRRYKAERDIAVMFIVEISGSTKGWINDAERESLVMLSEALEVLGDRYAIYGFGHYAQALRNLPRKALRRALQRDGAPAHRGNPAAGLHAHGRDDPPSLRMLNAVDARTEL